MMLQPPSPQGLHAWSLLPEMDPSAFPLVSRVSPHFTHMHSAVPLGSIFCFAAHLSAFMPASHGLVTEALHYILALGSLISPGLFSKLLQLFKFFFLTEGGLGRKEGQLNARMTFYASTENTCGLLIGITLHLQITWTSVDI